MTLPTAEELARIISLHVRPFAYQDAVGIIHHGPGLVGADTAAQAILARLQSDGAKGVEDAQPYKDALHDLVMFKMQADIRCVPTPTKDQWSKAWAEAFELTRNEP
jgi:hypothetical protein